MGTSDLKIRILLNSSAKDRFKISTFKNFKILNLSLMINFVDTVIKLCKHYFSPRNTFTKNGKNPDPYLGLTNPGSQITCGSY